MNTAVKYDTTENSSVHSNKTNVPGESIGFSERFGYGQVTLLVILSLHLLVCS